MPEIRWRPDLLSFELLGESGYSLEIDSDSNLSVPKKNAQAFIKKHWETGDWSTGISSRFLTTHVQLVALDRAQQEKCRVGIAGYWSGQPPASAELIGYVELWPSRADEIRLAKRGVRRLSDFIRRFDQAVVCEIDITMEIRENSRLSAYMTIELPYEDELIHAINGYIGPTGPEAIQESINNETLTGMYKALFDNGVNEGGNTISFDASTSSVTILPPEKTAFFPAVLMESEKIQRHLQLNIPDYERYLELALIPQPDNSFDEQAISVALPKRYGGSQSERHIAYLYRRYKEGQLSALLGELSSYSAGEIRCFGEIITRAESPGIQPLLPPSLDLQEDVADFLYDAETTRSTR